MVRSSHRSLFLVVFILVSCGFLGMLFAQKANTAATSNSDSDVRDSLKQFTQVYEVVEENYAEPVNPDKAIYNGAIPGMLHALDPHSNFFDPKSYSLLREEQRGKYYGVGMTVGPRNNKVIVIAPFVGTPAYRAGIHPGDIIIAVDGKPTDNMSTGDQGGGIFIENGALTIVNSTISGNTATSTGGGIFNNPPIGTANAVRIINANSFAPMALTSA